MKNETALHRRGGLVSCFDLDSGSYEHLALSALTHANGRGTRPLEGKLIGLAMFEPSTRTRLACEAAVKPLGGNCLHLGEQSSVLKGEGFDDTIRTLAQYVDALVIRHPEDGSADRAADLVGIPVVNGGDGRNELPLGGLLLFYQIWRYARETSRSLDGLRVVLYGPLKYSRACHSLMPVLAMFGVEMLCDCPEGLELQEPYANWVAAAGGHISSVHLGDVLGDIDVLVAATVAEHQRSYSSDEYRRVLRFYEPITPDMVGHMREDSIVTTIPPRVWEVAKDVDSDPHAIYPRLPIDGLHTKMAVFESILRAAP